MEKEIASLYDWVEYKLRRAEVEAAMGCLRAAEAWRRNAAHVAQFWLRETRLNVFDGWKELKPDLRERYEFLMRTAGYPLPTPRRRVEVMDEWA